MKNFHFILTAFFLLFLSAFAKSQGADFSIVFIHIGKSIPSHVPVALSQARAFNPDCPIILVANQEALGHFHLDSKTNITYIPCESLFTSEEHTTFRRNSRLDSQWAEGFWFYTSERFLYLQELMAQYHLNHVFHLEHDNLLYVNLEEILPVFISEYKGIAITMDNDQRCIPGFIYISNREAMNRLARYFADHAHESQFDMFTIAGFKNANGPDIVDHLPIISEDYVNQQPMRSPFNHTAANPKAYCRNFALFDSIFDAAALGQYLGGCDPRNGEPPGFINESCLFNPSLLGFQWIEDERGRNVPFALYGGRKFRINNLHIHSKRLHQFASKPFDS